MANFPGVWMGIAAAMGIEKEEGLDQEMGPAWPIFKVM